MKGEPGADDTPGAGGVPGGPGASTAEAAPDETGGDGGPGGGGLQNGLKQRHMSMIALGGVIGAGLFVGSGVIIGETGPAVIISFLLAGLLAILVMRMLGEMAVARPAVGSFYAYARLALGSWGGFTIGWLYWYFWVNVVALEAVTGATIIHAWLPGIDLWVISLVLMLLLTAVNMFSVKSFGEFEYWFAALKVGAISVFLVVGLVFLVGLWPGAHADASNLTAHGGFAPEGIGPILTSVIPAVGFFTGAEIAALAAAESKEPRKAVARATHSVVLRVLLFYVGSIILIVAIVPWNDGSVEQGPYVAALKNIGIPAADTVMNAIILVAVLSALNAGLYSASRIVFALTRNGDAPKGLTKLSGNGVPRRAILLATVLGYVSVIFAYVSPDTVFSFIVHSYGAVALFVYLLVALSQLRLRRTLEREDPGALTLKMWGFPYLSWFTVGAMAVVILAMAFLPATRADFLASALTLVVVLCGYLVRRRRNGTGDLADGMPGPSPEPNRGDAAV
ncbi:amino acid permease [Streptomyces iconiensis]|uniref:Amino acid permease n=1 Tax=Streptomyces iconiensis TaxID=1384038 RepID=A0ABT7A9H1_9ACTN|nr:amino acid permease [Streptomyces iconiensis]MDJ1137990.1 amino acid permease [Streptomyces iconiensis]